MYDNLDFTHAFEVFVNTLQGVSIEAIRQGLHSAGVKDNEVIVFSELMDAKSLFLTANADTVYCLRDASTSRKGPMVLEVPPTRFSAPFDDLLVPLGDRHRRARRRTAGEGGKYLIIPPDYDGTAAGRRLLHRPCQATTSVASAFGRAFIENKNDPKPAADTIQNIHSRIYPYEPGCVRHEHRRVPRRQGQCSARISTPGALDRVPSRASGKRDEHRFRPTTSPITRCSNEVVQQEPADLARIPSSCGPVRCDRHRQRASRSRLMSACTKILTDALAVANAAVA